VNGASPGGGLVFSQPRDGYRFSSDSVALAEFAQSGTNEVILDLCSGCGVVPILMWQRRPFRKAIGVETDAELVALARENVAHFQLEDRVQILRADVRSLSWEDLVPFSPSISASRFDVITCNPPYWPLGTGRINPTSQKATARHEISLALGELLSAGGRFLKPGGRLYLAHLEARQAEILSGLRNENFDVARTCSLPGKTRRILFEARLCEAKFPQPG